MGQRALMLGHEDLLLHFGGLYEFVFRLSVLQVEFCTGVLASFQFLNRWFLASDDCLELRSLLEGEARSEPQKFC
jgi:hypothetical protein